MRTFKVVPRTTADCRLFGRVPAELIPGLTSQLREGRPDPKIAAFFREQILGPQMEVLRDLHNRRGRTMTPFELRLAALVERDGAFFVCAERIEGCPPASGHAAIGALGAYQTSGRFDSLVACYVYDACTRRHSILALPELAVLDHHVDRTMGDLMWIGQHEQTDDLKYCLQSVIMQPYREMQWDFTGLHLEECDRHVPLSQRKARPAKVFYELEGDYSLTDPDERFVDALLAKAAEVFPNTTCIKIRPASKGHAVWFVYGNEAVLLVNSRDPNWHTHVRCGEMNAAGFAAALGWPQVDLVVIYSPDYEANNGSKNLLLPAPCSICRGIIHDLQPCDRGDVTIVSSNGFHKQVTTLSQIPERDYSAQERNSVTGR